MKKIIKLIILILIGLTLNSCYNSQEKEAIEICKRSCKYPLTFKVMDTYSILIPDRIETVTINGICYISYSKSIIDSFKIYNQYANHWDFNYEDFNYDYSKPCRIDSIHIYTVKRYCPKHTFFEVNYSCLNAFGVPCQHSRHFNIVNDYLIDPADRFSLNYDDFIKIEDTICINHFINNYSNKIFKAKVEVEEYLNNFESNFKLKQ